MCEVVFQRDPEVVFGPSDLLEAWGIEAKKTHILRKRMVFSLAAEGGKAQKKERSLKICVWLASVPQASEKPFGQKQKSGCLWLWLATTNEPQTPTPAPRQAVKFGITMVARSQHSHPPYQTKRVQFTTRVAARRATWIGEGHLCRQATTVLMKPT